ncbi:hypothetical protein AHAS_AhasUnG0026000 [Arachis hypogaea]
MADVEKKKFHVLDPINKKSPSNDRTEINKFVGFIISQMKVFVGGKPLIDNDEGMEAPYMRLCNICDKMAGDN